MSSEKHTLTITPPEFRTGQTMYGETFRSTGHKCPYCNGAGSFRYEKSQDYIEDKKCPVCKGVGSLRAMIAIKWIPDE